MNDLEFLLRTFESLSASTLYEIMQLRSDVFVVEQNCAYPDLDNLDQHALHLYHKVDGCKIIAYARILSPQQCNNTHSSIGRVVVSKDSRHSQIGRHLMRTAISKTLERYPDHPLKISAQTYLSNFYQRLGFVNTGQFYLEDQIPHQDMIYQPQ